MHTLRHTAAALLEQCVPEAAIRVIAAEHNNPLDPRVVGEIGNAAQRRLRVRVQLSPGCAVPAPGLGSARVTTATDETSASRPAEGDDCGGLSIVGKVTPCDQHRARDTHWRPFGTVPR